MKYLITMLLLSGCAKISDNVNLSEERRPQSEFMMMLERIGYNLYRYENKEVLCYEFYGSGVSCKWKEESK